MPSSQKYPAPPIIDAVVELRSVQQFNDTQLSQVVRALKANYDKHEETGEADVSVRVEGTSVTSSVSPPRPIHIFSNRDQNDFCRVERNKLHWSRLPPYEGWDVLETRIRRDLQRLPKKIGLPQLERIGVRFQNRLDIPRGNERTTRYEDYLSVHIALPALLDPHGAYMWTVLKDFEEAKIGTKITSGLVPPELPDTLAILLDLDVFTVDDLPNTVEALFHKLTILRNLKNDIFESCITDKARASFR